MPMALPVAVLPPKNLVPREMLEKQLVEVSDLRRDRMTEADAREALSSYIVYRFEKVQDPNETDSEGIPVKPTWENVRRVQVPDLSQKDIKRAICDLNYEGRTALDRKADLTANQQLQIEKVQSALEARELDRRFCHTLQQISPKMRKIRSDSLHYRQYMADKEGKKVVIAKGKTYVSKEKRSKKTLLETVSLTVYFKREPSAGQNALDLYKVLKTERETNQHKEMAQKHHGAMMQLAAEVAIAVAVEAATTTQAGQRIMGICLRATIREPKGAGSIACRREANKAYEANAPPPPRTDLAKQLFPSSSPSATHNGNIMDQFKRNGQTSINPSVSARTAAAAAALPAMNAPRQPPGRTSSVTHFATSTRPAKSFASLYPSSDPFVDEPTRTSAHDTSAKTKPAVYFAEDDFSDDELLDLDFEAPSALPTLPKPPVKASKAPEPNLETSATQAVPWSSSPASHFVHPRLSLASSHQATAAETSLKRDPRERLDSLIAPQPKKRRLPQSWKAEKEDVINLDEEDEPQVSRWATGGVTPAPKKKKETWNMTASALKEQKKQLRDQAKKNSADGEWTADEIRKEVLQNNMPKLKSSVIALTKEQKHVQSLVVDKGQSVFFTGPAGTGKSVLMRSIIAELKKKWARDPERLAITASTGLAACNIGGQTLHSFSGIGLGKEDVPTLVKKIRRNPKAKNRWLRTKALIIDEVSMVDGELFDKLSQIGRTIRNNGKPWGGIQLVVTGDFFQLPPVPDGDKTRDSKFAFEAATWNTAIDHTIGLTQVFRQRDPVFANMLNEMRLGRISEETVQAFKKLTRPVVSQDGLEVTELFPTRMEVDRANVGRLRSLQGQTKKFEAMDTGDPAIRDKLLQNMMAPKSIELKVGAQVMLIKNMDETLVNGSLGKVVKFMSEGSFDAWSTTDYGSDMDEDPEARARRKIKAFSREVEDATKGNHEFPVVEFSAVDGTSRTILCVPEDWKVETPTGEVQASRSQLPLILAWALSIHKAQGQTLERVKVDLGKVFEKGQAYVALSRATCQEGLQVLRFQKDKVMAHPRVVQFYNKLYSAEQAITKKPPTMADFLHKEEDEKVRTKTTEPSSRSQSFVRKGVEVIDLDEEEEAMASYGY
ncbi:ATP-dependent DNA helicase PIF1 [Colletotrichum orbiculare MAFF 240422]|uniref:ATP-dependent DNA helicase PIF1 n=1 Tax=Colletotrichum orbiculare (strain 104-T / ATCC 96160 / CBS 514.97 / LARS 414 / MAFF 240422) TaxID=1213857 RepID=A0A484FKH5_COLOR|nr:ATP-dependent DNA helicase PIF1 [Colletotrichum orbiculare MAFF 240422]